MIWYENLKDKAKKEFNTYNYSIYLMNVLISMFDYEGLPETMEKRFLELYLHAYGMVVIGYINNELYCAPASLMGEIDAYNLGTESVGVTPIGSIRGKRDIDVVVGFNNSLNKPDLDIYYYASTMADLDTSIRNNIFYSRMNPLPVAHDKKSKQALDDVLSNIDDGKLKSILSCNILQDIEGTGQAFDVLNITDVTASDKIQYLNHAKDDTLRFFMTKYGQAVQGTGKQAQMSELEVDGNTSISFILPNDMLEQRRVMCEKINNLFGTNITVEFSKSWRTEMERYSELESEDSSELESELESEDSSEDNEGGE